MKIYRLVSYHLELILYPILFPIILNYITQLKRLDTVIKIVPSVKA